MFYENFLIETNQAFTNLKFKPKSYSTFTFSDFSKCAIRTMNRIADIPSLTTAIENYNFVYENFEKIKDKISKHSYYYNSIELDNEFEFLDEEDANNAYTITNTFKNYSNSFLLLSKNFDEKIIQFPQTSSSYSATVGNKTYYLSSNNGSETSLKILDDTKRCICILNFENCILKLENNTTNYILVPYDDVPQTMLIYTKDKFKNLSKGKNDLNEATAMIEWDLINDDDDDGAVRLYLEDEEKVNLSFFILLEMSCLLLFKSTMEQINNNIRKANKDIRKSKRSLFFSRLMWLNSRKKW